MCMTTWTVIKKATFKRYLKLRVPTEKPVIVLHANTQFFS